MFRKHDFEDMFFKVHDRDLSDVSELDLVPELKALPGREVRYLCYMYDKGSPLPRRFTSLPDRKSNAATLAGFMHGKKEDQEILDKLYAAQKPYLDIIFSMLKAQNERVFSMIIAQERVFDQCIINLMKEVSADDDRDQLSAMNLKSKLTEQMWSSYTMLEKLSREFFGTNKDVEQAAQEIRFSPEAVAKKLRS